MTPMAMHLSAIYVSNNLYDLKSDMLQLFVYSIPAQSGKALPLFLTRLPYTHLDWIKIPSQDRSQWNRRTGPRTVNNFRHSWVNPSYSQNPSYLFHCPHEKINAGIIRLLLRLEKNTYNLSRAVSDTTTKTPEIIASSDICCTLARSQASLRYHTDTDLSGPHNHFWSTHSSCLMNEEDKFNVTHRMLQVWDLNSGSL